MFVEYHSLIRHICILLPPLIIYYTHTLNILFIKNLVLVWILAWKFGNEDKCFNY